MDKRYPQQKCEGIQERTNRCFDHGYGHTRRSLLKPLCLAKQL